MSSTSRAKSFILLALLLILGAGVASASHISGIRITQTGNTGLTIDVDVTAFYSVGSTEISAFLGTYYGQVPAVDWGDGSTLPAYGYGPSTGIPLVAASTVVNGIPARAFRGSFSHTYGSTGNYTIAANTACCPVTTPTNTLVTGTIQTTAFTTSTAFSTAATISTSFVQNTLGVDAAAPGFSKAFGTDPIAPGGTSTLTYTIDNTASTLDDNALDFTDNLPTNLVIASPANAANSCTGGTLTATGGGSAISYTGGIVAAGATCTISVDVTSAVPGLFTSTSGDLTSAFGNSGTASDTLSVGTLALPSFGSALATNPLDVDAVTQLTYTIGNTGNAVALNNLSFLDDLFNVGLRIANLANVNNGCGGTLTADPLMTLVSLSGGTVGAGATCTIVLDVQGAQSGTYSGTGAALSSDAGSSPIVPTAPITVNPNVSIIEVPALSGFGLFTLAGLLGLLSLLALRRTR